VSAHQAAKFLSEVVKSREKLTDETSRAAIRAVGSGSRTIEVVYHQKGIARRIRRGKERVTVSRRRVEGLRAAVTSEGEGRCLDEPESFFSKPILGVNGRKEAENSKGGRVRSGVSATLRLKLQKVHPDSLTFDFL